MLINQIFNAVWRSRFLLLLLSLAAWRAAAVIQTNCDVFAPHPETGAYRNEIMGGRYSDPEDRAFVDQDVLAAYPVLPRVCCWAAFDGHNGPQTADFLQKNFGRLLAHELASELRPGQDDGAQHEAVTRALGAVCAQVHDHIACNRIKFRKLGERTSSGSTVLVAVLVGDWLYCANVGDGRIALYDAGTGAELFRSVEHSLQERESEEFQRFLSVCTPIVAEQLRATNRRPGLYPLAVTRSLGDIQASGNCYAGYLPEPQCYAPIKIVAGKKFSLLLATDGLYEKRVSNGSVADDLFTNLHSRLIREWQTPRLLDDLAWTAREECHSTDDITAIIVRLVNDGQLAAGGQRAAVEDGDAEAGEQSCLAALLRCCCPCLRGRLSGSKKQA